MTSRDFIHLSESDRLTVDPEIRAGVYALTLYGSGRTCTMFLSEAQLDRLVTDGAGALQLAKVGQ